MACGTPRKIGSSEFPCGVCDPCRDSKASSRALRHKLEHDAHPFTTFASLTYADEHLPRTESGAPTLSRDHVKRFLRKLWDSKLTFRFSLVGEYGSRTFRPHYHALFFGLLPAQLQAVDAWPHGFTQLAVSKGGSCGYLAGYLSKSAGKAGDPRLGDRVPEFTRMSRSPAIGCGDLARFNTKWTRLGVEELGDVAPFVYQGRYPHALDRTLRNALRREFGVSERADERPEAEPIVLTAEEQSQALSRAARKRRRARARSL